MVPHLCCSVEMNWHYDALSVSVCLLLALSLSLYIYIYQVHLWPYIYHIHSLIIVKMRISVKIETMPIFIGTLLEFFPGNSIQGCKSCISSGFRFTPCMPESPSWSKMSLASVRLWVISTRQLILQVSGLLGVYECVDAPKTNQVANQRYIFRVSAHDITCSQDQNVLTLILRYGRLTWNLQITHLERKMI